VYGPLSGEFFAMSLTQPVALLVEDDELVSRSVGTLLERNQFRVVSAADGKEALELVDRFDFDVVLLDLMLPEINGFQFLRALRHTNHKRVPVVVITSRTDPVNHFWARRLGAVEYVEKPVEGEYLLEVLDRCLNPGPAAAPLGT
jgi:chemosensory pili system protein ChpA (sensor histidine kinase/response regulator)